MWAYEKKLQYPVKIKNPNLQYAKIIISQLGGADGELAAATRYLNQRYSMPNREIIGILTDVGTEDTKMALMRGVFPANTLLPNPPYEALRQSAPFHKPY